MNNNIIVALCLLLCFGCNSKNPSNQTAAQIILNETITTYNKDDFFKSTIRFNMGELEYILERDGNIANYDVIRQVDTLTYKAFYKNGFKGYLINDVEQAETAASNLFIQIRLEGMMYFFTFPRELDQNHVILKQLEDVIIKRKSYHAIHVSFTRLSEDDPNDEMILYIDQENHRIKYFAEFFHLTAAKKNVFKAAYNFRTIEGLLFADYFVLIAKKEDENQKLEDMYKLYNDNNMDELPSIIFENIEVELH